MFPKQYWITDVNWGKRMGAGGEATIYEGSHHGRAVVIRELHPPEEGNWASSYGLLIHKVQWINKTS